MALYESESSEDDPTSFTTTNVLLGYASKELTDDGISQLGGQPVKGARSSSFTELTIR